MTLIPYSCEKYDVRARQVTVGLDSWRSYLEADREESVSEPR